MPAAVLAAGLWPIGLEGVGLELMRWGVTWILAVAHWVAHLGGAITRIPSPASVVLPLMSIGALFLLIWAGRLRWIGMIPCLMAAAIWATGSRPAVLVAESGRLIGVMTEHGRALSKPRGDGFTARIWLEDDGDHVDQEGAAARPAAWRMIEGRRHIRLGEVDLIQIFGKSAVPLSTCASDQVIVLDDQVVLPGGPCQTYTSDDLRRSGALALTSDGKITSVADVSGRRAWAQ